MTSIVVAMIVILVVVACIVGMVLLGMGAREAACATTGRPDGARGPASQWGGEPPARLIKLIESSRGR